MVIDTRRGERKQEHDMKQVSLLLIMILTLVGAVVTLAHGQQTRGGSQPEVIASGFSAEVTGTVKNVDQKSGKLVLDTAAGPVNVLFPAEAVQGIKSGDQVTVSVALIKPPPSASPQTSPRTK
jgi:ferric-dicitrate binding protein FerR (iron transport regulator)